MRVEMVEKESVRDFVSLMTEKFLEEGKVIERYPYVRDEYTYSGFRHWYRSTTNHEVKTPWTEDVCSFNKHQKHPFQVLSEKERELDEKIRILKFDQMNELIDLFKHENPDWEENHMEEIWDLEMERDSYLI